MNRTKLVFLNTVAQVTEQVIGIFISLATFVLLARHLGVSTYGEYSIITTYLGFFAVAADWSLYLLVVKSLVANEDPQERATSFGKIAVFRLLLAAPCLALGLLLLIFFPYAAVVKLGIIIGSLAFLASSFSQLINGIFQAELKLYLTALLDLVYRGLTLLLTILALHLGLGLLYIIAGMVVAAVTAFLLGSILARQFIPLRLNYFRITRGEAKDLFSQSWALGLNGIFSNLLYRIDLLILSLFVSTAIVGIYGLPEKIMEVVAILPGAFIGSVFPIIGRYYGAGDQVNLERSVRSSFSFLVITGAFLSGFIFAFAKPIVAVAGGSQFQESVLALQILAFYPIFAFLGNFYYHLAVIVNQQRLLLWRTGSVLLLNIFLNLLFIPLFSYKAAAVITLITECIGAVISGYIIYRALPTHHFQVGRMGQAIIGAAAVNASLVFVYHRLAPIINITASRAYVQAITLLGLGLIGMAVYVLLLVGLGTIKKEDLNKIAMSH